MEHSQDYIFYVLNKDNDIVTTLDTDRFGEHIPVLKAVIDSKISSYDILTLEVPADRERVEVIEEDFTIVFEDVTGWREYIITEIEDEDSDTSVRTITSELSSIELLDEILVREVETQSKAPENILADVLRDTRWELGHVDSSIYSQAFNESVEYKSVLEAIDLISSNYSCEVQFSYAVEGDTISRRFVNLYKQFGRDLGKRFEIGKDITSVSRTVDTSSLKTAIIPYTTPRQDEEGNEEDRLDITNVEWVKANGDPADKPLGQKYLVDPVALNEFGRVHNGTLRNRFISIEMDTEDVHELIRMAWVQLGRYTKPKVTYELKVIDLWALSGSEDLEHERVALGDRAVIIDDNFAKPLTVESRVVELKRDLLNPNENEVVLGESRTYFKAKDTQDMVDDLANRLSNTTTDLVRRIQGAGGNFIYDGSNTPSEPRENDLWFRPHPERPNETQMLRFDGTIWIIELDTSELEITKEQLDEARTEIENVRESANYSVQQISNALAGTGTTDLEELFARKISSEDFNTLFFQNAESIGLLYEENGTTKAIISIQNGVPYIKGEHVILDGNTIVDGTFTVTDEMITPEAIIENLKASGIDATEISVINLNANHLTSGQIDLSRGITVGNNGDTVLSVNSNGEVELNVRKLTIGAMDLQQELDRISEFEDGKSAFEIAVENGFTGTEQQWLDSLQGRDGKDGADGRDGKDGIAGEKGEDGRTSYFHTAWANNSTGTSGFSLTNSTNKLFMGTYSDFNQSSSTNPANYTWVRVKGDKGDTGDRGERGEAGSDGVGIQSVVVQYYLSTSSSSLSGGSWSSTPPNWVNGRYMWTRTRTTFTNGSTSTTDAVNVTGQRGATGASGSDGRDGVDGANGSDGRSVSSLITEYYLSNSKTQRTGGSWTTNVPSWENGMYMWTRIRITYSNPSGVDYTTPTVDASWEAIDGIEIGGRNLLRGTSDNWETLSLSQWYGTVDRPTLEDLGLKVGEVVTYSIYVNNTTSAPVTIRFRIEDTSSNNFANEHGTSMPAGEAGRMVVTAKIPENTHYLRLVVNNGTGSSAEIDFKQAKLERGNKATAWTEAPEDIEDRINSKADQSNLDEVAEDLNNLETVTATREELGAILSALNDYSDMLDANEVDVNDAKQDIADLLSRVPLIETNVGEFVERWKAVDTHMTFGDEGLLIQQTDGSTGIRITTDRIDFIDGRGEPVAYITGQVMRINRGIFVDSAQIGEHKIETLAGGHTVFTWIN